MFTRFVYKQYGDLVIGSSGTEWDSKSDVIRVWDANDTEHVWTMKRSELVDMETVKVLWFKDGVLVRA